MKKNFTIRSSIPIMLKIVLDTNTYLSALVYGGMAEIILDLIAKDKLKLFVSRDLITEVLNKFREKGASENIYQKVRILLEYKGILVTPTIKVAVCRDPKDNFVLELAEMAKADYIITRDKDLLELPNHKWRKTDIVAPEEFLPLLRKVKLIRKRAPHLS